VNRWQRNRYQTEVNQNNSPFIRKENSGGDLALAIWQMANNKQCELQVLLLTDGNFKNSELMKIKYIYYIN